MEREGVLRDEMTLKRTVDVRYTGQGYELQVPSAPGQLSDADLDQIFERFHEAHIRAYGYDSRDNSVEVVNLRLTALATMPRPDLVSSKVNSDKDSSRAITGERNVIFGGNPVATTIYNRSELLPGDTVTGPAVLEQLESTTVVWPDQTAQVDKYLNLLLTRTSD